MKKKILLAIVIIASNILTVKAAFSQTETGQKTKQSENIKVLIITDDNYGSSFVYGDEKTKSIKQQFENFGWNITIAAMKDTVIPCEWSKKTFGAEPIIVARKISEIIHPDEFDAVIILPGRGFSNLINNNDFLNFIKNANQEKIIIAAWCRGVRLLAAADIIRNKNIIGHFDYFDEYKAAGANYINYSFRFEDGKKLFTNTTPPIRDGNIITTIRSLYYRNEMCMLMQKAIEENRLSK
ncbi:MAG: DJ-1/PfpI family protein [Bacteroidales bacterium]|nr:DJ-1/PfpI family protein [Bacteroidales bacterium]